MSVDAHEHSVPEEGAWWGVELEAKREVLEFKVSDGERVGAHGVVAGQLRREMLAEKTQADGGLVGKYRVVRIVGTTRAKDGEGEASSLGHVVGYAHRGADGPSAPGAEGVGVVTGGEHRGLLSGERVRA